MDRNSSLYRLARKLAKESIDWDSPTTALFQHEMRIDYVEHMPTLDLISTVLCDEEDAVSWMMTLTEIQASPEQGLSYDVALGKGRH